MTEETDAAHQPQDHDETLLQIQQNLRSQIEMVSSNNLEGFEESCRRQIPLLQRAQQIPTPLTQSRQAILRDITQLRTTLSLMLADGKREISDQLGRIGKGKRGLRGYAPRG
jgi:hypothetical protein